MKNDLNNQSSASLTNQPVSFAPDVDSSLPLSARITSCTGSGASYTFQVAGEANTDQGIQNHWNEVQASGDFSIFPFIQPEFNPGLPPGTNWTLDNAAGQRIAQGNTGRGTVNQITIYLRPFPDGSPSLQAQNTYHLSLTRAYTNFGSHTIPNTSGGLVIIANVDGGDDYFDAGTLMKADQSPQDRDQLQL